MIRLRPNVARLERFREAWPTRSRLVLVERAEKRLAGNDVHVDPGLLIVPVLVTERSFRGVALSDVVLSRREDFLQVRIAFFEGTVRDLGRDTRLCVRCAKWRGSSQSERDDPISATENISQSRHEKSELISDT